MAATFCAVAGFRHSHQSAALSPCKSFDSAPESGTTGPRSSSPTCMQSHTASSTPLSHRKHLDACSPRGSNAHGSHCCSNSNSLSSSAVVVAEGLGAAGQQSGFTVAAARNSRSSCDSTYHSQHRIQQQVSAHHGGSAGSLRNISGGAGGSSSLHTSSTQSGVSSKLLYEGGAGNLSHLLRGKDATLNGLIQYSSSGDDHRLVVHYRSRGSGCSCGGCRCDGSSPSLSRNNYCCSSSSPSASPPSSPGTPLRQHAFQRLQLLSQPHPSAGNPHEVTSGVTAAAAEPVTNAAALLGTGAGGSISPLFNILATDSSAGSSCCCYACCRPQSSAGCDQLLGGATDEKVQQQRRARHHKYSTGGTCSCDSSQAKSRQSHFVALYHPFPSGNAKSSTPNAPISTPSYACTDSRGAVWTAGPAVAAAVVAAEFKIGNPSNNVENHITPGGLGTKSDVMPASFSRTAAGGANGQAACSGGVPFAEATSAAARKGLDQWFESTTHLEKTAAILKAAHSTAEGSSQIHVKKPFTSASDLTGGSHRKATVTLQGHTAGGHNLHQRLAADQNASAECRNGCTDISKGAQAIEVEVSYSPSAGPSPYIGPDPLPPCLYRRLYDPQGPVLFSYPPLQGARHPRAELRMWPRDLDRIISQNSSKRKVHRACWLSPLDKKVAFPVAVKFVEDGNLRDGRSIKREIECHLYIYQRLGQLMQQHHSTLGGPTGNSGVVRKPYSRIEDVWPCAEMFGYYLDRKNPGMSVLVTRKLSGPDFFDVIRTEHTSAFNARTAVLYEQHKLQWCLIAMERIAQYGRLGIRHNDIKPDNIVLDFYAAPNSSERLLDVKLIDLGTASMQHAKDFTGGTSWYESPEQKILEYYTKKQRNLEAAKQVDIGLPSDAWGAGLSITEVLMGRRVVDVMKPPLGPGPLEFRGSEGWGLDPKDWIVCARQALGLDREQQRFPLCTEAARHIFSMLVGANPSDRATVEDVLPHIRLFAEEAALQVFRKYHGSI